MPPRFEFDYSYERELDLDSISIEDDDLPIPLQPDTDVNATLVLYRLCACCQQLTKSPSILRVDDAVWNELFEKHGKALKNTCNHHRSSLELEASAKRGCHSCCILWANLRDEGGLDRLRRIERKSKLRYDRPATAFI